MEVLVIIVMVREMCVRVETLNSFGSVKNFISEIKSTKISGHYLTKKFF